MKVLFTAEIVERLWTETQGRGGVWHATFAMLLEQEANRQIAKHTSTKETHQ